VIRTPYRSLLATTTLVAALAVPLLVTSSASAAPTTPQALAGTRVAVAKATLLDTRSGIGATRTPIKAGRSVTVTVAGRGHIPTSGVGAVVLSVTVDSPTRTGSVTVAPSGASIPALGNISFSAHRKTTNTVVVPVGSNAKIALLNRSAGTLELVASVTGYYRAGAPTSRGAFAPVTPARVGWQSISASRAASFSVQGHFGVPSRGVGRVLVDVTVSNPGNSSSVSVYPHGHTARVGTKVGFAQGRTVTQLVTAMVGVNGKVDVRNNLTKGAVRVALDVVGYTLSTALPVPTASTSRYVRNISGASTDESTMFDEGCTDAQANAKAGKYLSLLDIGAQTRTNLPAGGVRLSNTNTRISYAQLATALSGYVGGYSACRKVGTSVTVAISTNNDGDWTGYPAALRAVDWATKVVTPVQQAALPGVTVVGASDIEEGFTSTALQAQQWITNYLARAGGQFIFNGSADGCPSIPGKLGACGLWTQADYYRMTHGISPSRIVALPQIYLPGQAVQWANIDLSGGGGITFAGALTEAGASATSSVSPGQGWALLWQALSTSARTQPARLAYATDLRIDS
jgi:hypothetical protein